MTLADRLLAGEHAGCATWKDVAEKLGVDERHMRVVRKTLAGLGRAVELLPNPASVGQHETKPTVHVRAEPIWVGEALRAFDASDFRNPEALPYVPPASPKIRKLTRDECPDGTVILWASDIHIPIQHDPSCRLMVECAERVGVKRVVVGGDGLDMNCLSKHAKESARTVQHATILEEVAGGRWLLDWFASKQTDYILGNHEDRLKRWVDDNPAFHGSVASNFAKICELPAGLNIVEQGGEVRLGNLAFVHGDAEFKKGTGGAHPAAKLLSMLPDQSTICGHLHRMAQACRTTRDEDGIPRTRRAWTMGHMSVEEMHYGYVSKNPNWQVGFALIRVFWEGERPRWTVYPIEVLFDRYNRPYLEFEGRVCR